MSINVCNDIKELYINSVTMVDPKTIIVNYRSLNYDCINRYYTLNKKAENDFYNLIGKSKSLSHSMYKHERDLWGSYIKISDNTVFQNYHFIANDKINCIIDIVENNYSSNSVTKFSHIMRDAYSAIFNVKGVDRIISYCDGIYTIYELDYLNSKYRIYVYSAEYVDGGLTFVPYVTNSDVMYENFSDFCEYDYDVEIETQKRLIEITGKNKIDGNKKISIREINELIKVSKCEINTDESGMVDLVSDCSVKYFIDLINSFKIPYKTLKKMSSLEQSKYVVDCDIRKIASCLSYIYLNSLLPFYFGGIEYLYSLLYNSDYMG